MLEPRGQIRSVQKAHLAVVFCGILQSASKLGIRWYTWVWDSSCRRIKDHLLSKGRPSNQESVHPINPWMTSMLFLNPIPFKELTSIQSCVCD